MSVIEAELVKLFKFKKSPEDFFDRQDYLDAICQAMEKVKDDKVFDEVLAFSIGLCDSIDYVNDQEKTSSNQKAPSACD